MRLLYALPVLLFVTPVPAAETLNLVTIVAPDNPVSEPFGQFIDTLFKRSQLAYTLSYLPAKRAGEEFKLGKFAGDTGRTDSFAQFYPGAIRVEPAFLALPIYAISRDLRITGWKDLEQRRIAYPRGSLYLENKLDQHAQLNPVDQIDGCIKMVITKRVDICVLSPATRPSTTLMQAQPALRLDQFDTINTYIWLAPQYQTQANMLGRTLKNMQKDGSLATFQAVLLNPPQPRAH